LFDVENAAFTKHIDVVNVKFTSVDTTLYVRKLYVHDVGCGLVCCAVPVQIQSRPTENRTLNPARLQKNLAAGIEKWD
jgi:hypothetical protein